MTMSDWGVVLFHGTSSALQAEKAAKMAGFDVKLIPTPRELSSDCGLALRFNWSQAAELQGVLKERHVEYVVAWPL